MLLASLTFVPAGWSQDATQPKKVVKPATTSPAVANQKANIQAYIELLRSDVRQQKAEIMGSVMLLSAADAAKFWPIYTEYDAELSKLNDQRLANIHEYALSYAQMTDAKADELVQNAMSYQKQRDELLAKYYDRVKQELGAITAARFVQFELLRNCRLLEQALEFHEEETRNAKGNYWGRNNPVSAGNYIPCFRRELFGHYAIGDAEGGTGRSAERKENHGSGRHADPYTNDRFHRYHQTKGGVSVHCESGDESASRRCGGGPERHDSLWQARFG
jgi:hypothetical protein